MWEDLIRQLSGPILVTGADGFIGSHLFKRLLSVRDDVYGTVLSWPTWRLDGMDHDRIVEVDVAREAETRRLAATIRPATVFWCAGTSDNAQDQDQDRIYQTTFQAPRRLVESLKDQSLRAFVSAGSLDEYGPNVATPTEESSLHPETPRAVAQASLSAYLDYAGRILGLPTAHLRFGTVYGPFDDPARPLSRLALARSRGQDASPPSGGSDDPLYIDDVVPAFLRAALQLTPEHYGQSFNIGANQTVPSFARARTILKWESQTPLAQGLPHLEKWARENPDWETRATFPAQALPARDSVTAIIACYKDGPAIPYMHTRLVETFRNLNIDYEIIFVNDGSPDNSQDVIFEITQKDPHVLGITHARNFGAQMAFRSGMEMATKKSCVLLDGDLQDPPELIANFVAKWREGYDVVYGRRIRRDMPLRREIFYKAFYRLFAACSPFRVPVDAGDFSLMDRRVVKWLLQCPERDLFMRGLRAYVGFKQTGVDYVRPERMFGVSTNNWASNIAWAKRGIFSFSSKPMTLLSGVGFLLLLLSILACIWFVVVRVFFPSHVPPGLTTVLLSIFFFGGLNLFAVGTVGEYVGKVMEEVKNRPPFIRAALIRNGTIRQILPDETT